MSDYKKESILAPLFKMLEALFDLFVPLVVASIIDVGIGGQDKAYIFSRCLLMLGIAIVGMTCAITAQYFAAKSAVYSAAAMRRDLYAHILSFGYNEMDEIGSTTLITRMTSDINQVQSGINMALRLFLRSPFIVFGAMIMACTIDFQASLIFLLTILLLSIVVFGVMFLTKPMYRQVQSALDQILGITRENLTGARVIRAFHQEKGETRRFSEANTRLTYLQKSAGLISGLTNPLTFIIINLAIIAVIYYGGVRVNIGSLTTGQVVALYNYMSQILVELVKLANTIVLETKTLASLNRIDAILDQTVSMQDGRLSLAMSKDKIPSSDAENDSQGDSGKHGLGFAFRDVSFTYEGASDSSLQHISCQVHAGETLGVIGGTGSGKSTFVNLLARFYDVTEGEILLDDQPITDYRLEDLRRAIAVVPQKAQLFKGTIRENLSLGQGAVEEEVLKEALRISQAADFVREREGGLDAEIEQGGRNLSGGQRQRLTLARALARNAGLLIMDDSASALDYATDAALRKAIRDMKNRPTTVIISQRASSMMYADQILVLEDGQMVGLGNHEELLKDCEVYREIYSTQYDSPEDKEDPSASQPVAERNRYPLEKEAMA